MPTVILVVNAGSSSLKFSVFAADAANPEALELRWRGGVAGIGGAARFQVREGGGATIVDEVLPAADSGANVHEVALRRVVRWIGEHDPPLELCAVGHRVVHGGERYTQAQLVDATVLAELKKLIPIAPLHQAQCLTPIEWLARDWPGVPQVACFDTAFHHAQHDVARRYGLPREFHDVGIKRYGFHGLSFEYIARALPRYLGDAADGRVIVAHLGSGASLCALRERKSVATTMGFTPLDGLVMGTRCGTLDPGVLLYLLREKNLDAARLEHLLYHESGLLGVSGISADMQVLLRSDDARAREAVELFVYRVAREIGSLAAALGGLDALVFTGGIGENAAEIRQRICADAAWLGVRLDEQANVTGAARISASNSAVSAWIIPTREDEIVARQTWRLLSRLGSFPNAITPR